MIQPISQFTSNYYFRRTFKSSSNQNLSNNTQQEIKKTKSQQTVKSEEDKNKIDCYIAFLQPNNLEIKKEDKHYIMHIAPDGVSTLELPIEIKKD